MTLDKRVLETLKKVAAKQTADRKGLIAREELFEPFGDLFPPENSLDPGNPEHRTIMAEILEEISAAEHKAGRPLLSAVCLSDGTSVPEDGFYELAEKLGLLKSGATALGKYAFYVKELEKVYGHWRRRKTP